mmetsp:Transcript_2849/g.3410  ORF Transcript_2849/g.3410 Transcript_2849/m.3410 type:complete len:93 (+) Transcript_2849:2231-2509(+)
MPEYSPTARTYLELDKKKRNAARLLSEQIRTEAALLQFERDAFWEAGGNVDDEDGGWSGKSLEKIIEPPPMPRRNSDEGHPFSFGSYSSGDY